MDLVAKQVEELMRALLQVTAALLLPTLGCLGSVDEHGPDGVTTGAAPASLAPGSVALGDLQSCAVTFMGGVQCWGDNSDGQLGNGSTTNSRVPVDVVGLESDALAVSVGSRHACALTTGGGVQCWGDNSYGQLGNGTQQRSLTPVAVPGLGSGVVALALGALHTCVLRSGGGVKCWGNNEYGQVGNNSVRNQLEPVDVAGLDFGVTTLASGRSHACAVTTGGGLKCWGRNHTGQLGNNSTNDSLVPTNVHGLQAEVVEVALGTHHTCARTVDGGVMCWGENRYGQLGNDSRVNSPVPIRVVFLGAEASGIFGGLAHSCASTSSGVKCWGQNYDGQLGDNSTTDSYVPVDVVGLSGTQTLARGATALHTCAMSSTGRLHCWGWNAEGQLGINSEAPNSLVPVRVIGF